MFGYKFQCDYYTGEYGLGFKIEDGGVLIPIGDGKLNAANHTRFLFTFIFFTVIVSVTDKDSYLAFDGENLTQEYKEKNYE